MDIGPSNDNPLTDAETNFASELLDSGALHSQHPFQAVDTFIQNHLDDFLASATDASQRPDIQALAGDAVQASLAGTGPQKFMFGGVTAGIGGAVLSEAAAIGTTLAIGTFGAQVLGVAIAGAGLALAVDGLLGSDTLGFLENHVKQSFNAMVVKDGSL